METVLEKTVKGSTDASPAAGPAAAHAGRISRIPEYLAPRNLSAHDAGSRLSAYVYGNIVALATLFTLSRDDSETGTSALIMLGVSLSTFVAHAFAETIGRRVRSSEPLGPGRLLAELRDSAPVLTSGLLPAALLAFAWWMGLPGLAAQVAAAGFVLVRLLFTGTIIRVLTGRAPSARTVAAGVIIAVLGAAVTLCRVLLGH